MGSKGSSINTKSHSRVMEVLLRLRMFYNNGASDHALSYSAATKGSSHRRLDEVLSFF